jgi:hypothetical protein
MGSRRHRLHLRQIAEKCYGPTKPGLIAVVHSAALSAATRRETRIQPATGWCLVGD